MIDDVARGCAYLDVEIGTDWPYRIDTTTLDMSDYNHCVMGQLTGLGYWLEFGGTDHPVEHGFDLPYFADDREWEELNAAWINAIVARRSISA